MIKNISTTAMATFENDQGGTELKGVSDRAIGYTYSIYRERNTEFMYCLILIYYITIQNSK